MKNLIREIKRRLIMRWMTSFGSIHKSNGDVIVKMSRKFYVWTYQVNFQDWKNWTDDIN